MQVGKPVMPWLQLPGLVTHVAWQPRHAQHAQQLQTTGSYKKKWLMQILHGCGEQQHIQWDQL